MTPHAQPSPAAVALTQAADRRYRALSDLVALAKPGCPTCGGRGRHLRRVEYGITGDELVACHCTQWGA